MEEPLRTLKGKGPGILTMTDHVGVKDEIMEEGQHLNHLVLRLGLSELARTERLRYVGLEEGGVDCVDDLHINQQVQAHIEEVLAVDRLLSAVVWDVITDARVKKSQLMHTSCTQLEKVRHVHLLDVAVEDELQAGG